MRDDGIYTDEDWGSIYGVGGPPAIPSWRTLFPTSG